MSPTAGVRFSTRGSRRISMFFVSRTTFPTSRAFIEPSLSYTFFPGRNSSGVARVSPGMAVFLISLTKLDRPLDQPDGQFYPFRSLQKLSQPSAFKEPDQSVGLGYREHRPVECEPVDRDPRAGSLDKGIDVSVGREPLGGDIAHRELKHLPSVHLEPFGHPSRSPDHLLALLQAGDDAERIRIQCLVDRKDGTFLPLLALLSHVPDFVEIR